MSKSARGGANAMNETIFQKKKMLDNASDIVHGYTMNEYGTQN